ncbi:MAG: hypothetical protein LQ341_002016 [Variospora aurantia]|nr:MAG: hypothetical protein LQ341_002016 [Variospora aurantia]
MAAEAYKTIVAAWRRWNVWICIRQQQGSSRTFVCRPKQDILKRGAIQELALADRALNQDEGEQVRSNVQSGSYSPFRDSRTATRPFSSTTPLEPTDTSAHDIQSDDTDCLSTVSAGEEGVSTEHEAPKTAAEIRAEKRKMKRFRLTHNQTRFLLSEYSRQAHPDAAQRERLSREIPGLSPRQVQVWFQNRAKLKRLTVDDQESMLKSRALPIGFDPTQSLHQPYDTLAITGSGGPSSFFHPPAHPGYDAGGLSAMGRLRSVSEAPGITSPASMSSSFGDFYSRSESVSASDMISPTSTSSDRSHFFASPISHGASPHMQPNSIRTRAASLALPSRTIMAHVGGEADTANAESARLHREGGFQHGLRHHFDTSSETPMRTDLGQTMFYPGYPGMPFNSVVHGGPRSNFLNDVADYAPYDPSYSTNNPRRASESMIAQSQYIMPIQPPQSATLPAPSEFPSTGFPSSNQFGEARVSIVPTYDYIPETDGFSQNDHHAAYHGMENLSLVSNQASLYSLPGAGDRQDGSTSNQEAYEGWDERR